MTAPYLVVALAGDSNTYNGKYVVAGDAAGARIFEYKRNNTVVAADEPLDALGYAVDGSGNHMTGSTVALCRHLRDSGNLPNGYDILIVCGGWGGTAFPNFWATTGLRKALDGAGGTDISEPGFLIHLNNALASHADNRLWFYVWIHGANDSGITTSAYTNYMIDTWAEIRSTCGYAPIMAPLGIPPSHIDPARGNRPTQFTQNIAAQQNIESHIADIKHIDTSDMTEIDTSNNYVHFAAVSHRGGTNNAPGNTGETRTFADSIAGRMYDGLFEVGWRMRATW